MKAARYTNFKSPIQIKSVPIPGVPPNGALIEVRASGICRSDWWGWQGFDSDIALPHVPGHEFAGVVAAVGNEVTNWKVGDRVTAPFVCGCGSCHECENGHPQVCTHQTQPGFTHWGSFAEFVVVHEADFNLVLLPDNISYVTAASLGCRFGTAYHALTTQAEMQKGQSVAILGCGGVGLSAIMIATALGAQVIAVDINQEKLDLANRLGAKHSINLEKQHHPDVDLHLLTGSPIDITIDALGKEALINFGLRNLRPRGKHIQIGLMENELPQIAMDKVISKELEVIGSHGVAAAKYPEMFNLIASGSCDPQQLVTGIVSLEEGLEVIENMGTSPPIGVSVIDMAF